MLYSSLTVSTEARERPRLEHVLHDLLSFKFLSITFIDMMNMSENIKMSFLGRITQLLFDWLKES